MTKQLTVAQTTRNDGNGRPIEGWFVIHYGMPVGPRHESAEAARATMMEYVRDIRGCLVF